MADDLPVSTSPYSKLPDLMKSIIDRELFAQFDIEIEQHNGLTLEQGDKMMDVIRGIILKRYAPNKLVLTLKKTIGLDETKSKKLALDLLGRQFLPMEWYIGNVEGLIKELGGDLAMYQAQARKNYPEVYDPETAKRRAESEAEPAVEAGKQAEPSILHLIDERLQTNKGRAEVLLRLTALSQEIEEAMKTGELTETEGQRLLHSLDALSYAVNTQDLNPLEVAAIKRRLKNVLAKLRSSR